jgi:glycine C-acetyltransferase
VTAFYDELRAELAEIEAQGLTKRERVITSPQAAEIVVFRESGDVRALNLCANNYLGLADHPALIAAAKEALDAYGYGISSVRFICGTQDVHRRLEAAIADFLGMEDAILYAACFDANGGVFEPLFDERDAIISDALNHASIIDGVRLSKAKRYRYANNKMDELEMRLAEARAAGARRTIVVTDGVFSMDGVFADLEAICGLAERHDALVMVDDSHATGFIGAHGRGTPERSGVEGRVDIVTGTLGKALGGGSGGFAAARKPVIDLLRQRSRPYLFSNALPPATAAVGVRAIELVRESDVLRVRLAENAARFRAGMTHAGFALPPGEHPIIPIMLGDARLAQDMAAMLFDLGVYVIGFSYPVVPKGQARIRTQMSAALTSAQIDRAVAAFAQAGRTLGLI